MPISLADLLRTSFVEEGVRPTVAGLLLEADAILLRVYSAYHTLCAKVRVAAVVRTRSADVVLELEDFPVCSVKKACVHVALYHPSRRAASRPL